MGRGRAVPRKGSGSGRKTGPGAKAQIPPQSIQPPAEERVSDETTIGDDLSAESGNAVDEFPRITETDLHGSMHGTHEAAQLDFKIHDVWDDEWAEGRRLLAPEPRAGYVQRWVRYEDSSLEGQNKVDQNNIARRTRGGWRPRLLETVPESDRQYPILTHSSLGDVIAVDGMILCEMEEERYRKKRDIIKQRTIRQSQAVADDVKSVAREGVARGFSTIHVEDKETARVSSRDHGGQNIFQQDE